MTHGEIVEASSVGVARSGASRYVPRNSALGSALWFLGVVACSDTDAREESKSRPDPARSGEPRRASSDAVRAPSVAGCGLSTGWLGDDQCIDAPDPSAGFQLHFGPKDYDDPEEIARYTLGPGEEKLLCTYSVTPNEEKIYYDTWQNRLRPGSHHMIVSGAGEGEDLAGVPCAGAADGMENLGIIGGNTTTVMPLADVAPENEGIAKTLPPHARVAMQLHFFNASDEPILMEAWQNIYYKDPAEVKGESSPIQSIAGLNMSVERGTTEVIQGTLTAPQELRVLDLYSHNHDHTQRFTVFLKRAAETERTRIYESYDWEHPLLLPIDSIHENPEIDRDNRQAGGMTGELKLSEGDTLEFECEISNTDVDVPLRFANEAHTAEMCIMRGDYAPSFGRAWTSRSF